MPLPVVPVTSTSPRSSSAIFLSTRRQPELVDGADLHRDDAEHQADRAALLEDVAAETAEPGDAVGEVDFLRLLELLPLRRSDMIAALMAMTSSWSSLFSSVAGTSAPRTRIIG